MIVGSFYAGDDLELALRQHDVYSEALGILVGRCNRLTRMAIAILQDTEHAEWGRVERFDHRTMQVAHDLLAAVWRFKVSPPQASLLEGRPVERAEHDMTHWLDWLEAEVSSWIDESWMIRLVQVILTNQNQPIGYDAESSLASMIAARFHFVPWADSWHLESPSGATVGGAVDVGRTAADLGKL